MIKVQWFVPKYDFQKNQLLKTTKKFLNSHGMYYELVLTKAPT